MKNFWPIGTVVRILEDNDTEFMIIGYLPQNEDGQRRDYVAVRYPMGAFNKNVYFFFNHENISEVVFEGYKSKKCKVFLRLMNGLLKEEEESQGKTAEANSKVVDERKTQATEE